MCDDNCENLKPDRIRCESCRTINLARIKEKKPNMQIYDKCTPTPPCLPVSEVKVHPTCIKICSKDELKMRKGGKKICIPHVPPPPGHGMVVTVVKAGLLVGAVYWSYSQGVWGDQQQVTECVKRWQEYMRSLTTRRPPEFDKCGKVVVKESSDSLISPLYHIYKDVVTTCFAGVVKFPTIVKCMYLDYQKVLLRKEQEANKERQIRKKQI